MAFPQLNAEQRRAAETVRGPVCILAGAGSGKTTTITARIARQVETGAFAPGEILAVTFTDKAAGEMRARLEALGVHGVRARTFHSAALAQLAHFGDGAPAILASKALILQPLRRALPKPYCFRPLRELATEIERARNARLTPDTYLAALDGHEPPLPADLAVRVFRRYEERKREQGRIDFEDVLELTIRLFDERPDALAEFRARYRAFTVDEYQDVNLLQQALLERWLGDRDDLCVVGDDYQSIYSFTGATPRYLLAMSQRYPHAAVIRLEENHRSSPQVLAFANRLVPRLGGAEKRLRAVRPGGPEPTLVAAADRAAEVALVVARVRELELAYEEMAVLVRINARSEDFEEAFAAAGIPFQVRGGAFLRRPAARRTLQVLRRADGPAAAAVRAAALDQGWVEVVPEGVGEEEATRQSDLARLVRLAEEFGGGAADFVADLEARFGAESEGRGVNVLSYHRAKGLEFEAVFLPRLEQGELPYRGSDPAEERRLLYVGITRAKRHLHLSWVAKPSRFLEELGVERKPEPRPEGPVFAALREWRLQRAKADGVPAYVVFHDRTLAEIAECGPQTLAELARIAGVGPAKLDRYGPEVLAALAVTP
ncbi:MAG: ATP-dependent DNA helicase UvrD2 [Thermoleophilia bacterium]|nr:ATP-dependent DNA helicase UvrD2 [Thermoleophilia bacterium]